MKAQSKPFVVVIKSTRRSRKNSEPQSFSTRKSTIPLDSSKEPGSSGSSRNDKP